MHAPCAAIVVKEPFGHIFPVRNLGDFAAQHAFGIIHQLLGRLLDRIAAIGIHQLAEPLDPQFSRGDLRFKVAHHQSGHTGIAADITPKRVVALARFDQF